MDFGNWDHFVLLLINHGSCAHERAMEMMALEIENCRTDINRPQSVDYTYV